MPKFGYKDGCLLCNQCGRLNDPPSPDDTAQFECPCGNAEDLSAIQELVEFYNRPPDRGDRAPEKP